MAFFALESCHCIWHIGKKKLEMIIFVSVMIYLV